MIGSESVMNMRLRRLQNDHRDLVDFLRGHPAIRLVKIEGDPPEKYHVEYLVKGVEKKGTDIMFKDRHVAEIILTLDYPSQEPLCRMLTPVFHPNIDPHVICITDRWAAGESLTDVVVRIGRMLCYQIYNIKSPRNAEAAKWTAENLDRFPLDAADLARERSGDGEPAATEGKEDQPPPTLPQVGIGFQVKEENAPCANCRTPVPPSKIQECLQGHKVCPDCILHCRVCGAALCVLCDLTRCSLCHDIVCPNCQVFCHFHRQPVCRDHVVSCRECGVRGCDRCLKVCPTCGGHFCRAHFDKERNLCSACQREEGIKPRSCPRCLKIIPKRDAKFCPSCGNKI